MSQAADARHFYDRISGVYDALADRSEHEARELGLGLLSPSGFEIAASEGVSIWGLPVLAVVGRPRS